MGQKHMKGSKSPFIVYLLISSLMFQGCGSYSRLTSPKPEEKLTAIATTPHKYAYTLKIRLYADVEGQERPPSFSEHERLSDAEKALLDSLSSHGIRDIIKSDKIENDRISIVVYDRNMSRRDEGNIGNILLVPIYISWFIVSFLTVGLVPLYKESNYPVEIHIINPVLERNKQLRIIQTEYSSVSWIWMPFAFKTIDNIPEDVEYSSSMRYQQDAKDKEHDIQYLGWRRIFDRVIGEVEGNQ